MGDGGQCRLSPVVRWVLWWPCKPDSLIIESRRNLTTRMHLQSEHRFFLPIFPKMHQSRRIRASLNPFYTCGKMNEAGVEKCIDYEIFLCEIWPKFPRLLPRSSEHLQFIFGKKKKFHPLYGQRGIKRPETLHQLKSNKIIIEEKRYTRR